jgi:hypothetical protein
MTAINGVAIPTDIYDVDGNLLKIEFHSGLGEFLIEAVWDERDEQTKENQEAFRKWAYRIMRDRDYAVELNTDPKIGIAK